MKKILFFLALFTTNLFAQEHQFLTPIGAYEGIAGNTGIARDKSIGAVIYNPAGLASIKSSKLSASGSAFSQNKITLETPSLKEDVEYIQTIPSQITTSFNQKHFNWAFSVIVTKSQEFDYALEAGTASVDKESTDGYNKQQETLFGPTIAFEASRYFKVGLSLFAAKRDEKNKSVSYADYNTYSEQDYFQSDASAIAVFPVVGLLFTPNKNLSVGLKFTAPSTKVSGGVNSKRRYVYWDIDGNGTCPPGLPDGTCSLAWYSNDVTEKANFERPMEIGFGISGNISQNLKILLDINNQFSKKYTVYKKDANNEFKELNYKNTVRGNLGIEYLTSHTDALTFGLMYNPNPLSDDNNGELDLDFMGATVGYRSIDDIADSSFGFFYNTANSNSDGIKTTYSMYGLFVSTSINFLK
jgi:hypothetical protein